MSRSFRNQFIASLNSGRRKSSEWSSAAGRGGKLPPPLVLRMWLLWLLCLEIERSGLMWKILMSLFQKLDFTNIKHTHPPEFMVAGLRPPKSLLRWGLNFPDEFNFLTDCLCEYPPPKEELLQKLLEESVSSSDIDASCNACLWRYNLFYCRLITADLINLSDLSVPIPGICMDYSLHRSSL